MNKETISNFINTVKAGTIKYSPEILTGIGIAGMISTTILAVKATPKALRLIEEAEKEKGEKLTKWEKTKTATKPYLPAILLGTSTVACIFGAQILNQKQQASLVSAYALLDQSYKEYKKKLIELYGEETHQDIVDTIAIEKAEDTYVNGGYFATNCDLSVEEHSSEPKLFYEEYSKRFF